MSTEHISCKRCKKKFRPRGTTAKMYPGTALHSGKGFCTTCVNARKRAGIVKPLKLKAPKKEQAPRVRVYKARRPLSVRVELGLYQEGEPMNVTNLRNFIDERRSRGIPPEGIGHRVLSSSGVPWLEG